MYCRRRSGLGGPDHRQNDPGLLRRPNELQSTIAVEVIGLSPTAQVARQRPFLLVAPDVLSHHKDLYRSFLQNPRVDAFEVIVEPAQLRLVQFDTGVGAEVDIPGIA